MVFFPLFPYLLLLVCRITQYLFHNHLEPYFRFFSFISCYLCRKYIYAYCGRLYFLKMATLASPIPCALLNMTLSLLYQESPSTECGLSDLLRTNRMQQKVCCVTSEPFSFCLFSWNPSLWMLPVGKLLSTQMPWFEESKPHGEAMVCQYSGLQPQMSILIILAQAPAMWIFPHDSNPSHLSHP